MCNGAVYSHGLSYMMWFPYTLYSFRIHTSTVFSIQPCVSFRGIQCLKNINILQSRNLNIFVGATRKIKLLSQLHHQCIGIDRIGNPSFQSLLMRPQHPAVSVCLWCLHTHDVIPVNACVPAFSIFCHHNRLLTPYR